MACQDAARRLQPLSIAPSDDDKSTPQSSSCRGKCLDFVRVAKTRLQGASFMNKVFLAAMVVAVAVVSLLLILKQTFAGVGCGQQGLQGRRLGGRRLGGNEDLNPCPEDEVVAKDTMVFFDWDDTLFPTRWRKQVEQTLGGSDEKLFTKYLHVDLEHNEGKLFESLVNVAQTAKDTLEASQKQAKVVIITNAGAGWFEKTAQRFASLPDMVPQVIEQQIRGVCWEVALEEVIDVLQDPDAYQSYCGASPKEAAHVKKIADSYMEPALEKAIDVLQGNDWNKVYRDLGIDLIPSPEESDIIKQVIDAYFKKAHSHIESHLQRHPQDQAIKKQITDAYLNVARHDAKKVFQNPNLYKQVCEKLGINANPSSQASAKRIIDAYLKEPRHAIQAVFQNSKRFEDVCKKLGIDANLFPQAHDNFDQIIEEASTDFWKGTVVPLWNQRQKIDHELYDEVCKKLGIDAIASSQVVESWKDPSAVKSWKDFWTPVFVLVPGEPARTKATLGSGSIEVLLARESYKAKGDPDGMSAIWKYHVFEKQVQDHPNYLNWFSVGDSMKEHFAMASALRKKFPDIEASNSRYGWLMLPRLPVQEEVMRDVVHLDQFNLQLRDVKASVQNFVANAPDKDLPEFVNIVNFDTMKTAVNAEADQAEVYGQLITDAYAEVPKLTEAQRLGKVNLVLDTYKDAGNRKRWYEKFCERNRITQISVRTKKMALARDLPEMKLLGAMALRGEGFPYEIDDTFYSDILESYGWNIQVAVETCIAKIAEAGFPKASSDEQLRAVDHKKEVLNFLKAPAKVDAIVVTSERIIEIP